MKLCGSAPQFQFKRVGGVGLVLQTLPHSPERGPGDQLQGLLEGHVLLLADLTR